MNTTVSPFRARYGRTIIVGAIAFAALYAVDLSGTIGIANVTLDATDVRSALFGALIGLSGLFLTVLLAVLAVVTSLSDDRQVVIVMKQELKNYDELVHRLFGPITVVLVLAIVSIVCLLLPGAEVNDKGKVLHLDRGWWIACLPCAGLSLALGLFAQTSSVAHLLAKVLLFKKRAPDVSDSPAAARARQQKLVNEVNAAAPSPMTESDGTTTKARLSAPVLSPGG